jgi:hypothetical protein
MIDVLDSATKLPLAFFRMKCSVARTAEIGYNSSAEQKMRFGLLAQKAECGLSLVLRGSCGCAGIV